MEKMSSSQTGKLPYKSKFPIARIKKIMQADEEVGKVAQITPVVVSKALELFMQSIVDETIKQARIKQAKKVTVAHMRSAIHSADQFDFLIHIIDKHTNTGGSEKDTGHSSEKIQENKDNITFHESNPSSKKKSSN
ncbi:hypothetical protein T552_01682 [Pneumocystis carinii B80]|uniref:Transcription factor CBF/NF-Y/archaeal histone domain-containing protein n=1 Tax=Pneumocystis carinii (strain B80) TaxID=1408658 RepID=A0A0W4ZJ94_PNEC8|nr:hypothetical protein T552_01682 [Pneumocystis carinii B80]KTW28421.1 hypothetical protein T552_01682 [Pneumocystis carinii B80]